MINDIITAAILALILTWIIKITSKMFTIVVDKSTNFLIDPSDKDSIMDKCYYVFPIENIFFKGVTYTRSMKIKVTTNRKRTIIGEFIGTNENGMICVLTAESVVVQGLDKIEEITTL